MSDVVIQVENLSKRYLLGAQRQGGDGLRHRIESWVRNPLREFKSGKPNQPKTKEFWALKDVSFEIKQGDVVGFIGRNGAGKSTLLKILSRITEPTDGCIKMLGRVASLLEVGTGFHPELTGRENIFLNGAILGMSRAEIKRKFDEIVDFSEVENFLDTPVKRYSSGMYVRLAFAVAAHLEPEILIVDEVLAVGDAQFQKKCLGKMGEVSETGRTVLFVSHNMNAISNLCNRAILLKAGKVEAEGDVSKVSSLYFAGTQYSSDGDFNLSAHPQRESKYPPILQKVRLCGADGKTKSRFFPDEFCHFEIDLQSHVPVTNARLCIAIEDNQGRRLMTFASYFEENNITEISGHCRVRCVCGSLELGEGRYMLSVSISDKKRGLLDSIDEAGWFDIDWNNNFKDGEIYSSVYGPVLRKSVWTII